MSDKNKNEINAARVFECRVRSRENPQDVKVIQIEAADGEAAIMRLQQSGHLVVSARELNATNRVAKDSIQKIMAAGRRQSNSALFNSVSTRELIFFAMQLATLLKAGISLVRSLEIIARGAVNKYFERAIREVMKDVSDGRSLADSLRKHPKIFPWLWITLVEVGEIAGNLPEVLREISQYQESSERVKGKVISALFYPAVLLFVCFAAVTFLMVVIIPKFEVIFTSQNMTMPVPTQIVITISMILRNYFIYVILAIGAGIYFLRAYGKSATGSVVIGYQLLKIPVFGTLFMQVSIVRFCRGLATMLKAGIPLIRGLETAGVLCGNAHIKKQVDQSCEAVAQGHGFGEQLEKRRAFPVFVTQLISVGEEVGEIDSFLRLLADYYEEEMNQILSRLSSLIEPIMLVIMAAIIGGVVISVYLPIVQMSTGG